MALSHRLSTATITVVVSLLAWLLVGISAPWQSLVENSPAAVVVVATTWAWLLWTSVVIALLVPSPLSNTALHAISPLAVICALVALDPLAVFGSVVAIIVAHSSVLVDRMVQGGAYGLEQRFALRTPLPYMAPAALAWAVLTSTLIGGSLLVASQQWIIGVPILAVGLLAAWNIPLRLHRLSRRWLVIVPAGVVIHDHLVLAETIMTPRNKIASVAIVDAAADNADFTGGVVGPRLAVELRDADKVVLSQITAKTLGTGEALHVKTYSVAPRRIHAVRAVLTGS